MRNRSFVGIALVSLSDSSNNDQSNSPLPKVGRAPVWGDFLAIVSTLIGAMYMVLFKYRVRDESRLDMRLVFGFIGLFILLSYWPIGVVLHLSHLERFEFPDTNRTVFALLASVSLARARHTMQ